MSAIYTASNPLHKLCTRITVIIPQFIQRENAASSNTPDALLLKYDTGKMFSGVQDAE
jgi:hypothetical protein